MIEVALGLIGREGRWFLQRRDPQAKVLPGLWEFPGGKVEPGETPAAACLRELAEELGLTDCEITPLDPILHAYGDRSVRLHPFEVIPAQEPRTELAWGWFAAREIPRLPIPAANGPLVEQLVARPLE
ncbi:MAG TPA: (deoxy)nucleoside triphosphate pyrophosphohydrolase [Holophagaceae bacterium]|nr:(deoxy)nucleoside triphosphate pyrophosphohydrolase [Holophagaceae bacterium]